MNIIEDLDKIEEKIAWIQLHLKYTIEMYSIDKLHVETLHNNFKKYCTDRDNWMQFKNEKLQITNNKDDRITKREIATMFKEMFNIDVNDNTVRDECKRIGLQYERDYRYARRKRSICRCI